MNFWKSLIIFIFPFFVIGQNNSISIQSFYKDQLYNTFKGKSYQGNDFLPCLESEFNLPHLIRDSSKQYYFITSLLYKKHLVELKGENYNLYFSPVIELSIGENLDDSIPKPKKFQNTRGFVVEGNFFKNLSFTSSFYENQARFTEYQSNYFKINGELYPSFNSYSPQNAVIPGSARTKPFKTDGFDYAYSFGNIIYKLNKRITVLGGNNAHFIGAGYRSLFLSDNSFNFPYVQGDIKLSSKWSFTYMRGKLLNLMRRQYTQSAEAYYIPKAFSVNYLTYKANDKLTLSLFEGTIWSKGDSVSSKKVNPIFYNPIPGVSQMYSDNQHYGILGLNMRFRVSNSFMTYSQLATSGFNQYAFQIGVRKYTSILGVNNTLFQFEFNTIPSNMYISNSNHLLSYSNGNLPLAHVLGCGFNEFISRINYEYQRFYIDFKFIFTGLKAYQASQLNGFSYSKIKQTGSLQNHSIEIGYRFNKKINLTIFANYIYRNNQANNSPITKFGSIGIKTSLTNRYIDF
jgi:hypothetical protein